MDGRKIESLEKIYQRVLLDTQRRVIEEDHRVMLESKTLLSDSRIAARERRLERFAATVPSRGRLRAAARLRYLYRPQLLIQEEMSIEMASDETR